MAQRYAYRARNTENAVVTGIIQANGLDSAKKILVQNGLTPISVTPPRGFLDSVGFLNKVPLKEKTLFARQVGTMVEAGLTLSQSIRLMTRQMKPGKFKTILEQVLNDLQDGFSFSTALSKHPDVFDAIFINVVRSGEATGKLEIVLSQLATSLEKDLTLRNKVRGAMIYPLFVIGAMFLMAAVMMIFVIPRLTSVFRDAGAQLPLATTLLIAVSDLFVNYWWAIILVIALVPFAWRSFLRTPAGAEFVSKAVLRIPIFGPLVTKTTMSRFGRLLSMLLSSGVPMLDGLRLITNSFTNVLYRRAIIDVTEKVERGIPMSVPTTENPVFPLMVGQMIALGEQTGKMDEVMMRLASYYDDEVDATVGGLTRLIEPIIILVLAVGVMWLVFAILLPIYNLSSFTG
jgi:type IV pilus assembly protein PilC